MKKIIAAVIGLLLIGAGLYFGRNFLPQFSNSEGELHIESSPKTTVFINGEKKGETPYTELFSPGEYEVKLLPEDATTTASWQRQAAISAGVQTFVSASLSNTDLASTWYVVSLEKIKRNETEVSVFASTDGVELFFDGERKGTTPLSFQDITPGAHEIKLLSPGTAEQVIPINVVSGYKVAVSAQLAVIDGGQPGTDQAGDAAKTETETKKVTILDTPTGWLRVRSEPSTAGTEVAKVDPGKEFPFLEEDGEWYKIEYADGESGWISSQYAEKVK
ncbi:MAG TPA: SH3 domain-containing protein [Patescibacteria group bacterium]|nr:SH3 domain-containing protein [Patescibacteria group bacterium]